MGALRGGGQERLASGAVVAAVTRAAVRADPCSGGFDQVYLRLRPPTRWDEATGDMVTPLPSTRSPARSRRSSRRIGRCRAHRAASARPRRSQQRRAAVCAGGLCLSKRLPSAWQAVGKNKRLSKGKKGKGKKV